MCVDVCADMCIDMCVDTCVDMCIDMCVDMCVDIRWASAMPHWEALAEAVKRRSGTSVLVDRRTLDVVSAMGECQSKFLALAVDGRHSGYCHVASATSRQDPIGHIEPGSDRPHRARI